ncbi:MAG: L-threonylcarbamoyladenylate synthase type 1 TsaC [Pantoea sp. Brub]|nr:L-threonylcarbamoyladenylate synthase type 1 TsaC [Pantoea sp. Brub]
MFSKKIQNCINHLNSNSLICYPTEAIFGLGCDPDNKIAVNKLLILKKRSVNKGLILVASDYSQLKSYINHKKLLPIHLEYMFSYWPGPNTFVVPASRSTPYWLTGKYTSIAVRISNHPDVKSLCMAFGKPLISTSANFTNEIPCREIKDVIDRFGKQIVILPGEISGQAKPSEIRDVTGRLIRQG